jgi:hypothetical protein
MNYNWTVPYIIQDNFLEDKDFKFVQKYAKRIIKDPSQNNHLISKKIHQSTQSYNVIKIGNPQGNTFKEPNVLNLYDKYSSKITSMLSELAADKAPLADHHTLSLIVTYPNAKYPTHTDSDNKLLSCVLYVSQENIGTMLYSNSKQEDPFEVEWKPNRLFVFSRTDDSWHSWQSNHNYRATLVWNIMLDK